MSSFTFIHAADLHLDSPMQGLAVQDAEVAALARKATETAFRNLIDLCLSQKADFLLIAGDVYDGADRSLGAQFRFLEGMKRLSEAGVQVFITHGNHDPLDSWSDAFFWPEGVKVFGGDAPETVLVERDGVTLAAVTGMSYRSRAVEEDLSAYFEATHPELFQIGLLHATCGKQSAHETYAPCRLKDLKDSGFDYWALGHVHTHSILSTRPHVVYPGNLQGRHIREAGARGCYVVQVEADKAAALTFHALDALRWTEQSLSLDHMDSMEQLYEALSTLLDTLREENEDRPVFCRLRLEGRSSLSMVLRQPDADTELLEWLREAGSRMIPLIWIEQLRIQCTPPLDLEERRKNNDLLGELLRMADGLEERPELEAMLAEAWKPLTKQLDKKDVLSAEEELELLREATLLCATLLEEEA